MTDQPLPRASFCGSCFLLVTAAIALAGEAVELPPIVHLKEAAPKATVFDAVTGKDPLVLRSAEDASKYFDQEALAKLKQKVDFKHQVVLVFAWKDSGGDKLDYRVLESFPEQVVFEWTPGLTKDLRSHTQVYALRSNVKWKR